MRGEWKRRLGRRRIEEELGGAEQSTRDPWSRKALLGMTDQGGLGGWTEPVAEQDRLNPHPWLRSANSAAPGKAKAKAPTPREKREGWPPSKAKAAATSDGPP